MDNSQRIIGLTGGIATGKSTVSQYMQDKYQIPVLDADAYARQAVEPGSPILQAIANRYGSTMLQYDGSLDRSRLGEVIFSHPQEKAWLEQQIHPFVRQCFADDMAGLQDAPIVVQSIPLLFEADLTNQVTEVWVVTCTLQQQHQRLMQRNQLTLEQAEARIRSQMPLAQKASQADVVLDNSGDLPGLFSQIDQALQQVPQGINR
jgi:dephospho-CoA kinase